MLREHVIPAYPGTPVAEALADPGTPRHAAIARRARRIATDWSWATAGDLGGRLTGAFALWLAAVITAGLVGYLLDPDGVYVHTRWAVNIGDALVVGLVAGLLYVGRQAYRSPRFPPYRRRPLGPRHVLGPGPPIARPTMLDAEPGHLTLVAGIDPPRPHAWGRSCSPAIPRAASSAPRSCCN